MLIRFSSIFRNCECNNIQNELKYLNLFCKLFIIFAKYVRRNNLVKFEQKLLSLFETIFMYY